MKYSIIGENMQALKLVLEQGEKIYSDSGKLVSKSDNIHMTPRLSGGIGKAIIRRATGATALLTEFENKGGEGHVAVAGVLPGKIRIIQLEEGEAFVAEHNAFIAAQETVDFSMQLVNIGAAFFGGAGVVLQRFIGPGAIFINVIGDVIEHTLDGSRDIEVEPGHIAGYSGGLTYAVRFVDNIRTAMFGGVGLFLATFRGQGTLILHSVSRNKLATDLYTLGKAAAGNR